MVVVRFEMENVCLLGESLEVFLMFLLFREGAGKISATIFDLG